MDRPNAAARIGLLINENARAIQKDRSLLARLPALLPDPALFQTTARPREIPAAVEFLVQRGMDILCLCGGDGTITDALTELVGRPGDQPLPLVGLIRGGTINTTANYLGLRGHPDALLQRIVAAQKRNEPLPLVSCYSIRVNQRCGFTFGAAMVGRLYDEYNQLPSITRWSVAGYVSRVVASILLGTARGKRLLAPVRATMLVDGEEVAQQEFTVIIASCLENHGYGARPTYRGSSRPGTFQLVASGASPAQLGRQYHRLVAGRPFLGEQHLDAMVKHVTLHFQKPERCMIDGEVFEEQQLVLSLGPAIEVIRA